jgi:glutamate transport system substrate-binding protein
MMGHIFTVKILVAMALVLTACSSQQAEPAAESSAGASASASESEGAYEQVINSGPVAPASVVEASQWASGVKAAGVLTVGGTNKSALLAFEDSATGVVQGGRPGGLRDREGAAGGGAGCAGGGAAR